MAMDGTTKGSSSHQFSGESQDNKVQINIKTLDSHLHTFHVERNIPITSLKERIANAVDVPAAQQRLIFKGRVLKDDHILSDYQIENGDTLHLVARQPVQSGEASDEASRTNTTGNRGNEAADSMRARIGHSVVLGVNISDHEGTAADVSRIIGSVLNSFGIGTVLNPTATGNQASTMVHTTGQTSHAASGPPNGNSSVDQQARSQPLQQTGTTPLQPTGTMPLQNINAILLRQMAIPDSITTLTAFIRRMEQGLSMYSGYSAPSSNSQDSAQNPGQYPLSGSSPDALICVIGQVQRLLGGATVASLSHLSDRLQRERASADLSVRSQVQAEAIHVGLMMQHLGSLFLELGRTISTLRIGEAPMEPMLNSGPAVYINSSGPNPLMVQPVPHQPGPIFGIPSISPLVNVGFPDPTGVGDIPRNINIHVQTGTPGGLTGNVGEASRVQSTNQGSSNVAVSGQQDPSSLQRLSSRNVVTAVPAYASGGASNGFNVSLPVDTRMQSSNSTQSNVVSGTTSSMDAGLQANAYNDASLLSSVPGVRGMEGGSSWNDTAKMTVVGPGTSRPSLLAESSDVGTSLVSGHSSGIPASDTEALPESSAARRASKATSSDDIGNSDRLENSSAHGGSSGCNDTRIQTPLGLGIGGLKPKKRSKPPLSQGNANGQTPQLIAQGQHVLQSLVSQNYQEKATPTGHPVTGSSDASNTAVNRQNQNLAGTLSGMLQQMMPVVSQVFGASSSGVPSSGVTESVPRGRTREDAIDVQQAVQTIEREDHPRYVFCDLLDASARLNGERSDPDLVNHLGNESDLAYEFAEMMRRDIQRRLDSNFDHQ